MTAHKEQAQLSHLTDFGREILDHARKDEARRRFRDPGRWYEVAPVYDHWTRGVYPPLREAAEQMVADDAVTLHNYAHALISSQIFAFNLFLPFRVWDPTPLGALLSDVIGETLTVERIAFEYAGDLDVLAEVHPERGLEDVHTSSDVGVEVRTADGRRGLVLIEVKCTEGGFTNCNGRTSKGNRTPEVCASAERFFSDPTRCYLNRPYRAVRDRRYWEILAREYGSVAAAMPGWDRSQACPFAGDFQQIMRNHALALGMVHGGHFDVGWFGLVHHDRNPDVPGLFNEYRTATGQRPYFFRQGASAVVGTGSIHWSPWASYIRERYALEEDGAA